MAVRDVILNATEPDTLLFESLPDALGFKTDMSEEGAKRFARELVKSTNALQGGFASMLKDVRSLLFDATEISERSELSKAAKTMEPGVSDHNMKVFLGALSADMLEDENDWIKYVAMSLTDTPPDDWKDDHRYMFENRLRDMSSKFKRLAGIHFAKVSDSFAKPSYQVTVTSADGNERQNVVSLRPELKKKLTSMADKIIRDMEKKGLTEKDLDALVALLSTRLE